MQMGTGGVGAALGIGGFESQFVIMFETPGDFERFAINGYDASADAGAMVGTERTVTDVKFTDGRIFFVCRYVRTLGTLPLNSHYLGEGSFHDERGTRYSTQT